MTIKCKACAAQGTKWEHTSKFVGDPKVAIADCFAALNTHLIAKHPLALQEHQQKIMALMPKVNALLVAETYIDCDAEAFQQGIEEFSLEVAEACGMGIVDEEDLEEEGSGEN